MCKTKGSKERKHGKSLLSKIMVPMIILAILQVLAFGVFLSINGGFNHVRSYSYNLISEKTANRKNYVENIFNQKTSLVYETATEVNGVIKELLESEGLTIGSVKNDSEFNRLFLSLCSESLISLIRRDMVNDAFIILNSGSLYDKDGLSLRTGLYLRDTDVNENSASDNKDIFMEMGSSRIARDKGMPLDFSWSLYLDVTDCESGNNDFYYMPISSYNSKTPLYNLGFWSGISSISDSHQGSIKYTLPLVMDGEVYGVIGIGLLEKTLQQNIPVTDFYNESICYILGLDKEGKGEYTHQIHQGSSYVRLVGENKVFSTDRAEEFNQYDFTFEGYPETIGNVMELNVYNSGSPYRKQHWALISISDKEVSLRTYNIIIRTIVISMFISLIISVIAAVILSRKVSMPVKHMLGALNKSSADNKLLEFNSSGIEEIDVLAKAIAKLQVDVANYASKLKDDEYTARLIKTNQALKDAYDSAKKANLAKTDFLSRMSHDIRTPMNAIIGMTLIAKNNIDDKEKLKDCFDKITVSSNYLLSLINEVLDMSKIEGGKLVLAEDKINIVKLVENLIEMVRPSVKEKKHELKVQYNDLTHENVIGDNLRLLQVFMNILSNAVKYTPEGGHIGISISEKKTGQKKVGFYEFIFTDDGKGMSPEFIEKIFVPFEREEDERVSKEQGTGLGMTIAYNIVKMMDGDIKVKSVLNKGSTFVVTLYLLIDNEEGKTKAPEADGKEEGKSYDESEDEDFFKTEDFTGYRALLADDNELNLEIAVELLGMAGFQVETAQNGKEAVEKFQASEPGYYDFILMDIQMPVMNGYEAARAIRKLSHKDAGKIPVIAMTANAFAEDVRDAENAGMNAHIAKPLDMDRVFKTLNELKIRKG